MSVLIKGIIMPKNCDECPFGKEKQFDVGIICTLVDGTTFDTTSRPTSMCPLIELPPHGDLIDRDALNNAFTGMRFNADGLLLHYGDREDWYLKGSEVETLITNATTIIESEEKE